METNPLIGATPAESWSLALGDFGRACIVGALALNLLAIVLWILSARRPSLERWAKLAFSIGCCGFLGAFIVVAVLFVTDQYQFQYVFEHGSRTNQLRYKIAGTWSGQEGSILLWGTTSAIFGLLSARATKELRRWFTIAYASFLTVVAAILTFESPFKLIPMSDGRLMVPQTGQGLAPSLLNYWVVIHPPTIFSGFGSLTVLFAWSVAALVSKDLTSWIPRVRPWALVSMTLLGVGLAMGGFWAYETLGWGGFWMWDPVENTSFVPWVATLAFLHGLFVQVSRKKWHITNALLAGLPFILFTYGTFLTRSGFLGDTSVHSFANMNRSALWLLVVLMFGSLLTFLGLWGARAVQLQPKMPKSKDIAESWLNRDLLFGIGIWLLVAFGVVTAIGMSVPAIESFSGHKPKVVDEHLYNTVLSFFFLPFTVVMAIAPFVTWRGVVKSNRSKTAETLINIFAVALGVVGMLLLWSKSDFMGLQADTSASIKLLNVPANRVAWIMVLSFFCLIGIVGALWKSVQGILKRSLSTVGGMLAHLGVSVAMLGLIFSRGMEQHQEAFVITTLRPTWALNHLFMAKGTTSNFVDPENKVKIAVVAPKSVSRSLAPVDPKITDQSKNVNVTMGGENYMTVMPTPPGLDVDVKPGKEFQIEPGLYFNGIDSNGEPTPMIWPAIHGGGLYDLYVVVHNITFDASGPTDMKTGEQRLLREEQMLVTYNGLRTEGPLGQKGATFFAKVNVSTPEGNWDVEPMIKVGEGGIENHPAQVNGEWKVNLVKINAADKSATLQVQYVKPAYVAEAFYKPLTLLVWLGIGIMTVGGGLTAWARRSKAQAPNEPLATEPEPGEGPESQKESNATS